MLILQTPYVVKRVGAYRPAAVMKEQGVAKATMVTLCRAARAVGRALAIELR